DAVFTVTLFPYPAEKEVTVEFTTFSSTAFTGEDFLPVGGTLWFEPGETVKQIFVPIVGEQLDEPDEVFGITLTSPHNAKVFDGQAEGKIVDDDLGPALELYDASVVEGNDGDREAVFPLVLTEPSDKVVNVEVASLDDLATSPDDYIAVRGIVSFSRGEIEKDVRVAIKSDRLEEPDETFKLALFNANVAIADGEATGFIVDDDSPSAPRIALVPTPTARGYWLATAAGDVFSFGDAPFFGSMGLENDRSRPPRTLSQPVVGMQATPSGRGYWLVASDGGIFAFGNARFLGSTGGIRLN